MTHRHGRAAAKGQRRLLEGEIFLERFPKPSRSAVPVAAAYPSPYRIAMSNLGFHFLFAGLRRDGRLSVERLFADTSPRLLESGAPLSSRRAVLFSISYEEDILNLVRMLHEAGVEPLRERRGARPLVIAGGAAATVNPFPLSAVCDAVALGEGEGTIASIVDSLASSAEEGPDAALEALSKCAGVFVPGRPGRSAAFSETFLGDEFPHSVVLTPRTVFGDTLLVETGRGCPGRCDFCVATAVYRPFRAVSLGAVERLLAAVDRPVRKAGLVSTAVAANPDFSAIVRLLSGRGISVSFSSLRAEDLDDEKISLVGTVGTRSVSLAPESGSEAARAALGKKVSDSVYLDVTAKLRSVGVRRFTYYLLLGGPGESERVYGETEGFLGGLKAAAGGAPIDVHLNVIVPKPWTPLQFHGMPAPSDLEERQERLARLCRSIGATPHVKSVRSALRQALLSTGGPGAGRAVVRHVTRGTSWRKALAEEGVDAEAIHRDKGEDEPFPWDAIRGPTSRAALMRRFRGGACG